MVEDDGSGLPLFVSQVIHKAVIEVNEEGSKLKLLPSPWRWAAASAAGGLRRRPSLGQIMVSNLCEQLYGGHGDLPEQHGTIEVTVAVTSIYQ
uniref:Uncharacterized protein n=1 Tax=Oryza glumipatula TaxID=40148 RepID=A0A0E0BUN1_9ORYZ